MTPVELMMCGAGGGTSDITERSTDFDTGGDTTTPFGFDSTNLGSGTMTRDATKSYASSAASMRYNATAIVGVGQRIVRGNWFAPAGAVVETATVAGIGQIAWVSAAIWLKSIDTHNYTKLLRLTDTPDGGASGATWEVVNDSGTLLVRLEDYQGAASGVADRTAHSTAWPTLDAWVHVELGALIHSDNSIGWSELWLNGTQVGTRVTGRTIKLATQVYRRVQVGLPAYGITDEPAAEIWVDKVRLAKARVGA